MTLKNTIIRDAIAADVVALTEIYNDHILNGVATFEEQPITSSEMHDRIFRRDTNYPWLVLESGGEAIGYAYAQRWKKRSAYRFAAESSIYLKLAECSKGYGSMLYEALLSEVKTLDIRTVIGGITLPNARSVGLHEKAGFVKVAHFKEIGFKLGQWHDVGYWQLKMVKWNHHR